MDAINELCDTIGYRFSSQEIIRTALTHSSFGEPHNERLEFLGDAVLELIVTEYLFKTFEELNEGSMTSSRSVAVCEPTLCKYANTIQLGKYLQMGKGEESNGGRLKPSILADAMEALIGAIYLDGGYSQAKAFVLRFVSDAVAQPMEQRAFKDYKSALQEQVQAGKSPQKLAYRLVSAEGPDHQKLFNSQVVLGNKVIGTGKGSSRKTSEQEAARMALETISNR